MRADHLGHLTFHGSPKNHALFWLWASPFAWNLLSWKLLLIFLSEVISVAIVSVNSFWMPPGRIRLPHTRASHGTYKVDIFNMALTSLQRFSSYTCVFPPCWQMWSPIIVIINMCSLCIWNRWMSLIFD